MHINSIITQRKLRDFVFFHLVYEWEDIFSEKLQIPLLYETQVQFWVNKICGKIGLRLPFQKKNNLKYKFYFDMYVRFSPDKFSQNDIIPAIVDFYVLESELPTFYKSYHSNPFILISSMEAMHFLKEKKCPLKYYHFPLSLSDKYRITGKEIIVKKWDLVLIGRPNPVLNEFLNIYCQKYPDFIYVYRKYVNNADGKYWSYFTNRGESLGDFDSRESYMNLSRQAKVGFYSTPGIDGDEIRTKGFSQVTPRFLELIASGCHIIARYQNNADTDFYKLNDFCPSIETYEQFETQLNHSLTSEVPIQKYVNYLNEHYASNRTKLLNDIVNSYILEHK